MNRNALKIIAVATMLIDHVGLFFFDNLIWLRMIGRIAYPLFAFFIAEGMKHTRSRTKYALTMLLCAVITQIPYMFLFGYLNFNVLFTFLLSILIITLVENKKIIGAIKTAILVTISTLVLFAGYFGIIDYGFLGITLVLVFYFIKEPIISYLAGAGVIILMIIEDILLSGISVWSFIQIFALISIILLLFYNGQKGKRNLKYFFYTFYPVHFYIIWLALLII